MCDSREDGEKLGAEPAKDRRIADKTALRSALLRSVADIADCSSWVYDALA